MKSIKRLSLFFILLTLILFSCINNDNTNRTARPYYGEIDQAGVEFVESQDTIENE
jgi:hypothetical protein|tara:strand:- start:107 stop:274 length:168 start_codon:yes stop_codon:yes gene_type:complete